MNCSTIVYLAISTKTGSSIIYCDKFSTTLCEVITWSSMLSKVLIKLSFLKDVFYSPFKTAGINISYSSYPLNAIIDPGVW